MVQKLEDYILEDLREWKEAISLEIAAIEAEIVEKRKRININEIKLNVVRNSIDRVGMSKDIKDNHWNTYGQPLDDEIERLSLEINLSTNKELLSKKRSLNSLNDSLAQILKSNE